MNVIDFPIAGEYAHEIGILMNQTLAPDLCLCFEECYFSLLIEFIVHKGLSSFILDPNACK